MKFPAPRGVTYISQATERRPALINEYIIFYKEYILYFNGIKGTEKTNFFRRRKTDIWVKFSDIWESTKAQ